MYRNFLHCAKSTVLIIIMGDFAKPVKSMWSYTTLSVSFHLHSSSFWFWISTICFLYTLSPICSTKKKQQYYTGNVMKQDNQKPTTCKLLWPLL